jgi:hypothetical protein
LTALPTGLHGAVEQILGRAVAPCDDLDRLGESLAAQGVGLLSVDDPACFSWPGYWVAVTDRGRALVMFGTPSGPIDGALGDGELVTGGFVIAPHDLDLERRVERTAGTVHAIVVASETAGAAHLVGRCRAIAGRGLEGDRYCTGGGTFAAQGRVGQDLTLIDAAALEAAGLSAVEARRNVVTCDIDLDGLIGRRFLIGQVACRGERRAEPCAHLQRLTGPGVLRALVHRGGIRADVLSDGQIAVGDSVQLEESLSA